MTSAIYTSDLIRLFLTSSECCSTPIAVTFDLKGCPGMRGAAERAENDQMIPVRPKGLTVTVLSFETQTRCSGSGLWFWGQSCWNPEDYWGDWCWPPSLCLRGFQLPKVFD